MGWMDVTVVVLLILNILKGWGRGFILTLFDMVGFILAWITARSYYKLLTVYIIGYTNIYTKVVEFISTRLKGSSTGESAGTISTDYNIFEGLKLPKGIEELLKSEDVILEYGNRTADGIYQYMSEIFARMFIDLISFFVIFLAANLVIILIAHLLNGIGNLPILRGFNRIGGSIIGGVKGLLIVFIILALLIPIATMTDSQVIIEGLEKSRITRYMYDHNPIIGILKGNIPVSGFGI